MTAATIMPLLFALVALIVLDLATSRTGGDARITRDDGSEW